MGRKGKEKELNLAIVAAPCNRVDVGPEKWKLSTSTIWKLNLERLEFFKSECYTLMIVKKYTCQQLSPVIVERVRT